MCFLQKRLRASFSVEASVLLPLVTFVIIGMLYYICFLHDCALMQSVSMQAAETAAAARYFEGMTAQPPSPADTLQEKVIMCQAAQPSVQAQSFSLRTIYRSLKSYHSATAQSSVNLMIPVWQTAAFTGEQWDRSCQVTATTVDYPADWFKRRIRQKSK